MSWTGTLRENISELDLIASWASITQFDRVRDLCRLASAELKREVERLQANDEPEIPPSADPKILDTTIG